MQPRGFVSEVDPLGLAPQEPGAKLDAGKIRADLVLGGFALALIEVARVGTYGAKKYSDNGWVSVPNGVERYSDAMWRHYFNEKTGEIYDRELQVHHAAQVAWNSLARLQLILLGGTE